MEEFFADLFHFPLNLLSRNESLLKVFTWMNVVVSVLGILVWVSTFTIMPPTNFQINTQYYYLFCFFAFLIGFVVYITLCQIVTGDLADPCDGCLWEMFGFFLLVGGSSIISSLYYYRLYFGWDKVSVPAVDYLAILIGVMLFIYPVIVVIVMYYIKRAWEINIWLFQVRKERLQEQDKYM